MAEETIFSKIIRKEIPSEITYQDELVTAFRDISPQAPTHILIVPNKVIPTINDVSTEDETALGRLFTVAAQLAKEEGLAEDGYRLIVNCRDHGGQEVYHLHMHLIGGRPLGPMLTPATMTFVRHLEGRKMAPGPRLSTRWDRPGGALPSSHGLLMLAVGPLVSGFCVFPEYLLDRIFSNGFEVFHGDALYRGVVGAVFAHGPVAGVDEAIHAENFPEVVQGRRVVDQLGRRRSLQGGFDEAGDLAVDVRVLCDIVQAVDPIGVRRLAVYWYVDYVVEHNTQIR